MSRTLLAFALPEAVLLVAARMAAHQISAVVKAARRGATRRRADLRRNIIGLVWLGGIVLTFLLYKADPESVIQAVGDALAQLEYNLQDLLASLAVNTYQLMRALAIGLFPVFVVLSLLAIRRGLQARRALVVVGLIYFLLLYGPVWQGERISSTHWMGAFLLVAIGSAVMTSRLTAPLPGAPARWERARAP